MTRRADRPGPPEALCFSPFVLDAVEGRLLREGEIVPLRQRAFRVLHHLALRPGQLVTKEELFGAVWPDVTVSEIVLAVCVSELRNALGDSARTPRFVETVHGRGYRFIATVRRDERAASASPRLPVVGRDTELERLDRQLERAVAGDRQIVLVTGDAGIGKTTLVEAFLERTAARGAVWLARGQCVEQHGPGEPFMPVLEGLGRLCRESRSDHLVSLLREHAPSWLLQLPGLISDADREALQRQHAGVTRARMLREMVVGIEALTTRTPMVVVLEDLHWSDPSTLDLLVALARQRGPARLLVVGTCRPVDADTGDGHLLDAIKAILRDPEAYVELALGPLTEAATEEYLRKRFGAVSFPAGFARALHRRTGGNALFIAHVTCRLAAEGLGPDGTRDLETFFGDIPPTLHRAIERRLARVGLHEQQILESASIAGMEFTAGEVAAALDEDVETVDVRCATLAQREKLLRPLGIGEWPDGTATGRYAFTHALYVEVLQSRVAESRRRRLHQRIGERLEAAHRGHEADIAATLAAHFARSGDHARAFRHHRQAGEQAARRNAFTEATGHLRAALEAFGRLPDPEARALDELQVRVALGAALSQVQGFAAPEVGDVYARALVLSERIGNVPERFVVVGGLEAFYSLRGYLPTASTLARRLLELGEESGDHARLTEGHHALGCNRLRAADFAAATTHLEQAIALYGIEPRPDAHGLSGHDPKVCCLGHLACVLWVTGSPSRALSYAEDALRLAETLAHPPTLALALVMAATVHVLRREPRRVEELTSRTLAMAREYGLAFWASIASVQRGWALAELGHGSEAVELLEGGIRHYCAIGAGAHEADYRILVVHGYARIGRIDDAFRELGRAFDAMQRNGERYFEAELHRMKGELFVREDRSGHAEAEKCFREAIAIACRQQSKSLELRAAISLSRLLRGQERHAEGAELLREVYDRFPEGFDAPDLLEAATLLRDVTDLPRAAGGGRVDRPKRLAGLATRRRYRPARRS
jgi:DNA-binding winged helix-turn-helix (wHTH) protein/predicted ATPase